MSTKEYTCSTSVTYQQKTTHSSLLQHIYKWIHILHKCGISTKEYTCSTSVAYLHRLQRVH